MTSFGSMGANNEATMNLILYETAKFICQGRSGMQFKTYAEITLKWIFPNCSECTLPAQMHYVIKLLQLSAKDLFLLVLRSL